VSKTNLKHHYVYAAGCGVVSSPYYS